MRREGGNDMNSVMTIQEFHALLTSEKEANPLLEALHKLTAIEEPEDIRALAEEAGPIWSNWSAV
jgi:hypothetical protein